MKAAHLQIINETLPPVLDNFEFLQVIGKGGYSIVKAAKHIPTGCFCAAKIVYLKGLTTTEFNGIMREISCFMQVKHQHIASIYRISYVNFILVFFMELAQKGSLLNYVSAHKRLDEKETFRIFSQLFSAVLTLHHQYFVMHRDLKLENVLLDQNNNVKLSDFGSSTTFYMAKNKGFNGTSGYAPPEMMTGLNEVGEKCDVWSLGTCLYVMLVGRFPFSLQHHDYQLLLHEREKLEFPPHLSLEVRDLIEIMLTVNPDKRPSMSELQLHRWMRNMHKVSINIKPTPIVFYQVNTFDDVLKFTRVPEEINRYVVKQCVQFGIEEENLLNLLRKGRITEETTVYYLLRSPVREYTPLVVPNHSLKKSEGQRRVVFNSAKKFPMIMRPSLPRNRALSSLSDFSSY